MIRQQWTAMLAKLTAPMSAPVAAKALADMLPMLEDYPDAAFSLASLEHVASRCERVPTYAELRTTLGEWWKTHRPPERALPAPGQRNVEEEDRQFWKDMTDAEMRARIAEVDGWTGPGTATAQLIFRRGTVRGMTEHVPHRLGLLPPHWLQLPDENARGSTFGLSPAVPPIRSPSDQADAVAPPRAPGALSPEALALLRAQLAALRAKPKAAA